MSSLSWTCPTRLRLCLLLRVCVSLSFRSVLILIFLPRAFVYVCCDMVFSMFPSDGSTPHGVVFYKVELAVACLDVLKCQLSNVHVGLGRHMCLLCNKCKRAMHTAIANVLFS